MHHRICALGIEWVHRIEPLLYKVFSVTSDDRLDRPSPLAFRARSIRKLIASNRAQHLHDHVHHIYFWSPFPMEFIIDVLSMFDTVVDLVLIGSRGLLPMLRGLPLQRLAWMSCSPAHLRSSHNPYSPISHISIFGTLTAEGGTLGGRAAHRCHSSPIWPSGELTSR
jgi:hypothetical protein